MGEVKEINKPPGNYLLDPTVKDARLFEIDDYDRIIHMMWCDGIRVNEKLARGTCYNASKITNDMDKYEIALAMVNHLATKVAWLA